MNWQRFLTSAYTAREETMEELKVPDAISEFAEIRQFSAVKDGMDFLITLSQRMKKSNGREKFQAITFGYSVEGDNESEVMEEILDYISKREVEKRPNR